jgi:RNA polymerase sigma-70 factor (ECF subfamily)
MELQHDWNAFRDRLHDFIVRRIGDRDDAEDLLHDVLVKMQESLGSLRDHSRVQAWAYQITRNVITDYYRRRQAHASRTATLDDLDDISGEDAASSVEREIAACLRPMVEHLPESYRDAVLLADLDGITQREVAERLGISLSGAKSRVQRGREKLRELLYKCCTFELDRLGAIVDARPRCADCDPCASV